MKAYADNKRGYYSYEILEEFEAGIVLTGPEVKSVKSGNVSLKEAFATVKGGEIWLTNAHIGHYKPAGKIDYEPTRPRKLLLKHAEIAKLTGKLQSEGLTLIPLRAYGKNDKVKILLGLGRGKKKHDKREVIKRRDIKRDVERELKGKG